LSFALIIACLENVGALEYFWRSDTVCFVEWGEGLEDYLRKNKITCKKVLIRNINAKTREFEII